MLGREAALLPSSLLYLKGQYRARWVPLQDSGPAAKLKRGRVACNNTR